MCKLELQLENAIVSINEMLLDDELPIQDRLHISSIYAATIIEAAESPNPKQHIIKELTALKNGEIPQPE